MDHNRLTSAVENHPALAWLGSAVSLAGGVVSYMVEHAGDAAKVFGVFAAVFGMIAGYYTMRIQRRAWKRDETQPPFWKRRRR